MKIRKRIHGVIFGAVVLLTSFVLAASEAAAQTNAGDEYYLKKLEGVNLSENLCCVSEKTDGTGMYIWDGKKVWLLNYKDGGLSGIFASEDESGGYIYRDFFYYSDWGHVVRVNLATGKKESLADVIGSGICVAPDGRILCSDSNGNIRTYTSSGTLLATTKTDFYINNLINIDSNGNLLFETVENWVYWGYDHDMVYLRTGKLGSDNKITIAEDAVVMMSQIQFNECDRPEAILENGKLAVYESVYSMVEILDYEKIVSSKTAVTPDFDIAPVKKGDYVLIGPQIVWKANRGRYVTYNVDESGMLTEYDSTGKQSGLQYRPKYHVTALFSVGNGVLAIEYDKAQSLYYAEMIPWKKPTSLKAVPKISTIETGSSTTTDVSLPSGFSGSAYIFSSSDNRIASVSKTGEIMAWGTGTARITVEDVNNKLKTSFTVKVVDPAKKNSFTAGKNTLSGKAVDNHRRDSIYDFYGSRDSSYLFTDSNGTYTRIEAQSDGVLVEEYTAAFAKKSSRTIPIQLGYFCGAFCGAKQNYLVFGRNNSEENDEKEILRVVQYSKDWAAIKSCSIRKINTTVPCEAGSLRMDEANGLLYIHTSHEMYATEDGNHHQANMTFVINQSDMKLKDSYSGVMNINYGYVSHSFDQFIRADEKYVYRVDLGDAIPRGIIFTRVKVGDPITSVEAWRPYEILGQTGDNATGVSLGSFEISKNYGLITFNSVSMDGSFNCYGKRNAMVVAADLQNGDFRTIRLTNYGEDSNITVSVPYAVDLGNDHFLVMWEESEKFGATRSKFVLMDGCGTITSRTLELSFPLSECRPTLNAKGEVCWVASDASKAVLYRLNPYTIPQMAYSAVKPALTGAVNLKDGIKVSYKTVGDAAGYYIYRKTGNGSYAKVGTVSSGTTGSFKDTTASPGVKYTYTVKAFRAGAKSGCISAGVSVIRMTPGKITSITNSEKGITIKWNKNGNADGYYIYRKVGSGKWMKLAKLSTNSKVSFTDVKATENGTVYAYDIRTYKGAYMSGMSNTASLARLSSPVLKSVANVADGISVTWQKVEKVEGYYVYRKAFGDTTWRKIGTVKGNAAFAITDTGVQAGREYSYTVKAYKGTALSGCNTTGLKLKRLTATASMTVKKVTGGVQISWARVPYATGYNVYRKTSSGAWVRIATLSGNTKVTYKDSTAKAGTSYSYAVRAVNGAAMSAAKSKDI